MFVFLFHKTDKWKEAHKNMNNELKLIHNNFVCKLVESVPSLSVQCIQYDPHLPSQCILLFDFVTEPQRCNVWNCHDSNVNTLQFEWEAIAKIFSLKLHSTCKYLKYSSSCIFNYVCVCVLFFYVMFPKLIFINFFLLMLFLIYVCYCLLYCSFLWLYSLYFHFECHLKSHHTCLHLHNYGIIKIHSVFKR